MPRWLESFIAPPALGIFLRRLRAPDIRLALRLCLPAALVAIAVRILLLACMPAAFVHNDTGAALETAERLLARGAFALDVKKTFLAPTLYCVPALLHLPVLPFLAVVQHLLGVGLVFMTGLLTFAWLKHWRAFIVPVTLATALNPVLLWYEHTALAETFAIFGIVFVALTATAFARSPSRYTFGLLLLALLFMAGARPEGRLFGLFALVLVIRVLWGRWRPFRIAVPIIFAWTILLFAITRTGQSGVLLFTSVLQLTPDHLVVSPGIAETVRPLAERTRADWRGDEPPKLVRIRKELQATLAVIGVRPDPIAKRAGLETALRNLPALPDLALRKFVIAHRELPCGDFDTYPIAGQLDALTDGGEDLHDLRYADLLWGRKLATPEAAQAFLAATYHPLPGNFLTRFLTAWESFSVGSIAPISLPGSRAAGVAIHGLPWLYTAALLGLLCLAFRDRTPLNFHQLWGAFLLGLFLVIMVTANIRARFRVLFEPFWILYALAVLDTVLILLARWLPLRRSSK
jgi:hypothetical protein